MKAPLSPSDRAPGLHVAPDVTIPADAEIAPYVTIYEGVQLGTGIVLEQGAIIGRPERVDVGSRSRARAPGASTVLGDGSRVGSNAVIVAGARVGRQSYVADNALLREGVALGDRAMVGRNAAVSADVVIGDGTRIQALTQVGPATRIEEEVAIAPGVLFVGDPTMGRRAVSVTSGGILVRRGSRIGANAVVFPPAEIGEEAVVGAMSMVREGVPERTVVAGVPARPIRSVREDELRSAWPV